MLWPQIFRGVGMMMAMVRVNNIALGTLPPERVKNASGLFNLTRNLGGALGLALINTILDGRTDFHVSRLHDKVNWGNAQAVDFRNTLTQRFQGMGDASLMALKQFNQIVDRQAVTMSFSDAFFLLTIFCIWLSTLVVLVASPPTGDGPGREALRVDQLTDLWCVETCSRVQLVRYEAK